VNVISPAWVRETSLATGADGGTPAEQVAELYIRAIEDENLSSQVLTSQTF
jgi:hypothetical protein